VLNLILLFDWFRSQASFEIVSTFVEGKGGGGGSLHDTLGSFGKRGMYWFSLELQKEEA
jgi:hypothetical protein